MKISAKKLFSFINLKYSPEEFRQKVEETSNILTKIGFEVDSIEFEEDSLKGFVIANVIECTKHPESSKLSICKVNTGKETLQVLCGAPNVRTGINVILATQGAIIPKNGMIIQKTKLAGYESQGMICSADELSIGKNDGTILEIETPTTIGTPYYEHTNKNDAILEISITPNRGDALSYLGLSRELSAQNIGKLSQNVIKNENTKPLPIEIIENNLANSIFFGKIGNISYIPQFNEILTKCGISTTQIPLVNLLNYITEIYGQPMHLYDASKIKGTIRIRKSLDCEKLITISGQEIELKSGDIVIADEEKILSLAGIIGDIRSAISTETKEFILESCSFNRDLIFQTIRKYNIHTTASFRFERYVDSGNPEFFPQKLYAQQLTELTQTNFTHTFELPCKENSTVISCNTESISTKLGFTLTFQKIIEILTNLQFKCFGDASNFNIEVPSFRKSDVKQENDIVEEIIRSIGLEFCPRKILNINPSNNTYQIHKIKNHLARNLNEIITFPFVSQKDLTLFTPIENGIKLANPLNESTPYMRSNLIPSILHNISNSESLSQNSSTIFEIAKVFEKTPNQKPTEQTQICIARSGNNSINTPLQKHKEYNIFDIKEDTLNLIESIFNLKRESTTYKSISHNAFHPHQSFEIIIGRTTIAQISQIHPIICEEYKIKNKVFISTIFLENIPTKTNKSSIKPEYYPQILPNVKRELSIITSTNTTCLEILRSLQKITKNRFTASITDIFQTNEMKINNQQSLLISFEIFQKDKTLTSEEIEEIIQNSMQILKETIGASLRGNA
jgi:phenylalanyl-tRNA synthetase beta chain